MKKRVLSMIVCMAIMLGCMDTIVFGYSFSSLNEIEDGVYIIVSAIDENMVLDISGQSKDDGGNVHLWARHSGNSQKFSISKNGDYYSIVNVNSGKALCIKGDSNKSGANVHQWRIHSGDSQKWKFEFKSGGYVKIKSKLGNYLDASDGKSENGTNIQVYKSNDTDAQRWLLLKCPEKNSGKTPAEQAKNDLISLYEYEINDTVRLYLMMNEFMEADKFKFYSSAIKQGISSAVSILLKPFSNGKNGFAVVEELNDDADKKASIIFANTLSQTEAEFFSDFGSTVKYGKNFSNVAKSANTLNEMFNKSKNTAEDKEKVIEEFVAMLQKDFPGLVKEEKAKEVLQKMSNTDFLKFFDKTIDIADFCNNLMMYTSIYSTDIEICKEYMQRCPGTDSFIYIKLKDIVERLEKNYVEFLLDEFLVEEGIKKIDKGLWKIIAANPYGLHAKNVLSLIDTANMVVFDYIVKAPSYSSMNLDLALYNYRNMFDNSFITKERIQNLKSTYSPDSAIEFAKDFLVLVNITNELLENSKSFAKYNKKFGTAFVNLQIAKCETLKEKILSYVEIIEKDKTTEKAETNIIVPGTMTVSASKSNYTTKENVVLNWTSSSNATEYGLTVKRVEDGKTIFNSRLNGSSKNLGCLEAGTYTYVMRGHNANGKGPLTSVKQFTVEASNKNNIPEGNGDGYLYKSLDKDTSKPDFPGKWIRTSASTSGTVIGSIPYGEIAVGTKFSSDGKWVYVNYKNVEGWVMLTSDIFPYQGIYTCPVVTFNANGGSVTTSNKKVFINTPYGTLPTPERNNYIFDGWYTSSNGGTKITSSTNVTLTANQTLYAHWIEEEKDDETAKLTITFDPMGGKVSPASKKGEFNTPYGSLPTPTRNGYVFLGWYTVKGGGGNEVTSTHYVMRNYDHTLYAHWDVSDDQTCIITYNANGGIEPPSPQTVNEGERVTISNEKLSRSGYEFLGWSKNASSNKADYTPGQKVTINEDITLYAVWKAKDESFVLTIGDTKANVFGQIKYNDVAPIIENNRTMLPARFIAENLGADVEWIDKTRCVLITKEDTEIEIFIGNEYAKVNGKKYKLDSPAFIRDNRTYTPVRFICENLGANVEWNDKENSVKITLIKCSVCGSTNHTEHIASDGWEESLPAFVKNNQDDYIIEKRTEYLYETRETTTSDKNKKSGWTLYDTKTSEGSWSKWQEQKVTETSTRIVETREVKATYKTQYNYGAYVTKAGTHKPCLHLTDSSQEVWTGWLDYELPIKYSPDDVKGWYCATCASKVDSSRAGGKIINVKDKGGNKYFWYTYYQNNATDNKNEFYWKNERVVEDTPSHTEYRYKNIENVYYFERWTEGEWTSKKKSENSNCRLVDTRTVYKYESR